MEGLATQIEGLLHFASLTVALTIGYVGLDRIRPYDAHLRDTISKATKEAHQFLLENDAVSPEGKVHDSVYQMDALVILCVFARINVRFSWMRLTWVRIRLFRRTPMRGYFESGSDFVIVSAIATVATLFMLYLTAALLWPMPLATLATIQVLFFVYSAFFLWVVFTAMSSLRLWRIDKTGADLCERAAKALDSILSMKRASIQTAVQESVGGSGPLGTGTGPAASGGGAGGGGTHTTVHISGTVGGTT